MYWIGRKIPNEKIPRTNKLIPYFTAYLTHYFYYLKIRGERLKEISDSESASKNESIEK